MKIAFTGAGGTGKTTLATYISEKWGIPYMGSVSREVMKELGVANEGAQNNMTEADLLTLQYAIFKRRQEKLANVESYVTDRCALDNYIYGLRRCGSALTPEIQKEWEEGAIKDLYNHDIVFYAPMGLFPTEHDGTRVTDIAHQHLMDVAMYGFLAKHVWDRCAAHVYILNMSNLDRRKRYVDSLVSEIYSVKNL